MSETEKKMRDRIARTEQRRSNSFVWYLTGFSAWALGMVLGVAAVWIAGVTLEILSWLYAMWCDRKNVVNYRILLAHLDAEAAEKKP